jgi:CrcB protein
VLGGFTTFSAFALDTLTLLGIAARGGLALAMCWPRLVLSLFAVYGGLAIGRGIFA